MMPLYDAIIYYCCLTSSLLLSFFCALPGVLENVCEALGCWLVVLLTIATDQIVISSSSHHSLEKNVANWSHWPTRMMLVKHQRAQE